MTNKMFDTSPTEIDTKAKKKTGRRPSAHAAAEPEPHQDAPLTVLVTLGRLDGQVPCSRCEAECLDIVAEHGREWLTECCFCGQRSWMPVIVGHLKPKEKGFVLADGRFQGMTIEEAYREPHGPEYVEWAAKDHKRQIVRKAAQKFLLTLQANAG
jgi:hypothetical protein